MRRFLPLVPVLLAVAVVLATAGGSAGRDEEEEVAPKKPVKRILVDDDLPGGAVAIPDLVRAASSAKHPGLKKYYTSVAVACDRILLNNGKTLRVAPVPYVWDKDGKEFRKNADGFGAAVLDEDNRPGEGQYILPKDVRGITPFEWFAVKETERLIDSTAADAAPLSDRLLAGERTLTAVLFHHALLAEASPPRRRGPSWEFYKSAITDRLLDVRLLLVKEAGKVKDWPRLAELVARYAELYRTKPKVLQELYAARLPQAAELVAGNSIPELEKARDILAEYESRFPDSGNETAKTVKEALAAKAKELLTKAAAADGEAARTLLNNAKLLDPDNPEVAARRKELKAGYSVLVVGVNRMPRLMSPATAREDSERMAVELLFEGLLAPLPDEDVGRVFRPALAAGKPRVLPLAREVSVAGNAGWGRRSAGGFDAADLAATVQLMKADRTRPSAEAADWLADAAADPDRPTTATVKLARAHPDPRELLAFKVLPGRHLLAQKKGIADSIGGGSFARTPFGTGPFRLSDAFVPAEGDDPVKAVSFVPNAGYARRPGKIGEPELSEVRFVPLAGRKAEDLARDVSNELVHVLPDVPTADLDKYNGVANLAVVTPAANRRVYLLAVNHTVPELQSPDVRRGIAHAIDREAVLNDVYRAGTKHHTALTGPFPAGSWLAPASAAAARPLHDRDLAAVKLKDAAGRVLLHYPNDDPRAEAACKGIARMVNEYGKLEVVPEGVSPVELRERVEGSGRYQLAYLPFDYPDPWHGHALAALLDPTAAGNGGRNFLRYLARGSAPATRADDGLSEALAELKLHRDSEGEIKRAAKEVCDRFTDAMPFIPLWQLDRHVVFSTAVKPQFDGRTAPVPYDLLDPITLFANPGRWKLDSSK